MSGDQDKPLPVSGVSTEISELNMSNTVPFTASFSNPTNTQFPNPSASVIERLLSSEVPGGGIPALPNTCIHISPSYSYSYSPAAFAMPLSSTPAPRLPAYPFPISTAQSQSSFHMDFDMTNLSQSTERSADSDATSSPQNYTGNVSFHQTPTPPLTDISDLKPLHISTASLASALDSSHESLPAMSIATTTCATASAFLQQPPQPLLASAAAAVGSGSTASTTSSGVGKCVGSKESKRFRGPRQSVPDTMKDDKYHERRKRNNLAARRYALLCFGFALQLETLVLYSIQYRIESLRADILFTLVLLSSTQLNSTQAVTNNSRNFMLSASACLLLTLC